MGHPNRLSALEATQAQGKYNQLFQKLQMMTGTQMNQGMPGMQPGTQQPMQPGMQPMQPGMQQ